MLNKNKKNNFKAQAALMTLGTLAPMAPALMSNVGNIVAHADSTAVPTPQRLTTPADENVQLTPFTWTIRVVNQQNGQQLKSDDITFTPKSQNVTTDEKTGASEVHYTVKDTAGIFKSNDYTATNGDIDFNAIINQNNNSGSIRGNKTDSLVNKGDFENWVFGAKNSDGQTPYILPELNDANNKTATQTAQVSGDANHKVLTFNVIPNTAQTKNKNNNNNHGDYVVPFTGQDTGNNKTTTNNGGSTTNNKGTNNNSGSTANHGSNTTTNNNASANKTNSKGNGSQQSSQQDADTQQIIKIGQAKAESQRALAQALNEKGAQSSLQAKIIDILPVIAKNNAEAVSHIEHLTVLNGAKGLQETSAESLNSAMMLIKNTTGIDLKDLVEKRANGQITLNEDDVSKLVEKTNQPSNKDTNK